MMKAMTPDQRRRYVAPPELTEYDAHVLARIRAVLADTTLISQGLAGDPAALRAILRAGAPEFDDPCPVEPADA